MLKYKNSQSHLELILSFVIFVGFILAILIFLNPLNQGTTNYVSFEDAQTKILNNVSINYRSISLILNSSTSGCFNVKNPLQMEGNILVINSLGNVVRSNQNSTVISIMSSPGETFYKIYLSEEFNNYSIVGSCFNMPDVNYSFGVLSFEKSIFMERFENLNKSYISNYDSLKISLGIYDNFEFGVYDFNKNPIIVDPLTKHKLKVGNVVSRDILLKAINKNLTKLDVFMNLKVW